MVPEWCPNVRKFDAHGHSAKTTKKQEQIMLKRVFCLKVAHAIRTHWRSPNSVFQLEMCPKGSRTNTNNTVPTITENPLKIQPEWTPEPEEKRYRKKTPEKT